MHIHDPTEIPTEPLIEVITSHRRRRRSPKNIPMAVAYKTAAVATVSVEEAWEAVAAAAADNGLVRGRTRRRSEDEDECNENQVGELVLPLKTMLGALWTKFRQFLF